MKQWIEGIGAQNYAKTDHFIQRQGQRKISNLLVTMAMACGEKFYQGPEQVYFLGRKHLMQARRMFGDILTEREARSADGTVVVVGSNNALVTAYRNPKYIKYLRRCA